MIPPEPDPPEPGPDPPEPEPTYKYEMLSSSTIYTINGMTWRAWDGLKWNNDNWKIWELGTLSDRRFLVTPDYTDGTVVSTIIGVIGSSGSGYEAYVGTVHYHSSDGVTFSPYDNSFPADFSVRNYDNTDTMDDTQARADFGKNLAINVKCG